MDGRKRSRSELRNAMTSGTVENNEGERNLLEGVATIDLAKVGRRLLAREPLFLARLVAALASLRWNQVLVAAFHPAPHAMPTPTPHTHSNI